MIGKLAKKAAHKIAVTLAAKALEVAFKIEEAAKEGKPDVEPVDPTTLEKKQVEERDPMTPEARAMLAKKSPVTPYESRRKNGEPLPGSVEARIKTARGSL